VTLALYAPGDLAASPVVGVLLDRLPRKPLLNVANALLLAVVALIGLAFAHHALPFGRSWPRSSSREGSGPSSPSAVSSSCPIWWRRLTERPRTRPFSSNMNLATLAGPALGGILVAAVGVAPTLYAAALGYAVYAATLAVIPASRFQAEAPRESPSWLADLQGGGQLLRATPLCWCSRWSLSCSASRTAPSSQPCRCWCGRCFIGARKRSRAVDGLCGRRLAGDHRVGSAPAVLAPPRPSLRHHCRLGPLQCRRGTHPDPLGGRVDPGARRVHVWPLSHHLRAVAAAPGSRPLPEQGVWGP
jgi:hypothetical protein